MMRRLGDLRYAVPALFLFALLYFAASSTYPISNPSKWYIVAQKTNPQALERAAIAKDAFRHAWNGYLQYAFPDDALKPLSKSSETTRSSWGVTVVDGLPTAIMMQLPDVVSTMLDHIEQTNFAKTNASVSLFGTTIRYLGGILSAYDLLTASHSSMDPSGDRAQMLLQQAQNLVEALIFAYDTPSGIPQNNLRFFPEPAHKRTPVTDITAAGVPTLEFSHFSELTGSPLDKAPIAALNHTLNESALGTTPFPGLSGRYLDLRQGHFVDAEGGWYGGAGGFYEYLLKLYILSPKAFEYCIERWTMAADSSITFLASNPSSRPDLTFLASYNGTEILYNTDHTAHFAAANFLLAGSTLQKQKYIDFGLRLVDSQIEMHRATLTGLGPDTYAWLPQFCRDLQGYKDRHDDYNTKHIPNGCRIGQAFNNQSLFYDKAGFYSTSPVYKLRPEVLESLYYAYRITRDEKYREASWEIFQKILVHTKIESGGFAGLLDVNILPDKEAAVSSAGTEGGMEDLQYSYMLAETVMYAWLIHTEGDDEPWHIQANGQNLWVFNTEGHPLRIQGRL